MENSIMAEACSENWQNRKKYSMNKGGQMSLTKNDITRSVCANLDIPWNYSVQLVEAIFDIIKDELETGYDIKISGFGKWTVRSKRARNGRNPQTGEKIVIDARRVVKFRPSPLLIRGIMREKIITK
jgi:integration host factor subunit alpha